MKLKEFKEKISTIEDLRDVIYNEDALVFTQVLGVKCQFVHIGRDYDTYQWVLQVGQDGPLFALEGSYNSWAGTEIYDDMDWNEVKKVEKTITVYE